MSKFARPPAETYLLTGSCIFQKEMKTIKTPYFRCSETLSYWAKSAKISTQTHSTYYIGK